jgi:hypothetical protein
MSNSNDKWFTVLLFSVAVVVIAAAINLFVPFPLGDKEAAEDNKIQMITCLYGGGVSFQAGDIYFQRFTDSSVEFKDKVGNVIAYQMMPGEYCVWEPKTEIPLNLNE